MTRVPSLAILAVVAALLAEVPARGQLPVAPPPREVRPDGSRDPVPKPEPPAKPEDPATVVDRIIKNSKDVGDKLAQTDTGAGTRKAQGKILSDIDSLINRQENPPPPKPDENQDQQKDKKDDKDRQKNNDPMTGTGMGKDGMPPSPMHDSPMGNKGAGGKQGGMPRGNTGGSGRRPRAGERDQKKSDQPQEQPDPKEQKKGGQPKGSNDAKDPGGAAGGNPGGKAKAASSLPFNEDVAKDVWGHLPDKLRRQMTQYYKEDVMPKYSELLRLYYSSLSDKSPGATMPRK